MLSKNKLQNLLTDNYSNIQERGGTKLESAQGMADAIVSYAEDAELPEVKLIIPYEQIGLILINGKANELELKKTANKLREKLLDKGYKLLS